MKEYFVRIVLKDDNDFVTNNMSEQGVRDYTQRYKDVFENFNDYIEFSNLDKDQSPMGIISVIVPLDNINYLSTELAEE